MADIGPGAPDPTPSSAALPEAAAEAPVTRWWRRITPGVAGSAVLFAFLLYEWMRWIYEHFEDGLSASKDALAHADTTATIDGFVVGVAGEPITGHGWLSPFVQLAAGAHGMWVAVLAGGWPAVLAGIISVAAGIALLLGCGAALDEAQSRPLWVRAPASVYAVAFGLVAVVATG